MRQSYPGSENAHYFACRTFVDGETAFSVLAMPFYRRDIIVLLVTSVSTEKHHLFFSLHSSEREYNKKET